MFRWQVYVDCLPADARVKDAAGMNIAIPLDEDLELPFLPAPDWAQPPEPDGEAGGGEAGDSAEPFMVAAADDDLNDFDEDDFDDEFDDDFEEELEDEYELSEFEDVTEDDLVEGDDDLDTLGGDFVDEDAEPEEPAGNESEAAEGKEASEDKSAKEGKKKGKSSKSKKGDEDLDED
ncbi:MAG: hypothetical protein L0211_21835 [Planctomycetaceae bacterium]|nr:hypothetical protein [Planctomycetaceae bacterium]